MAEMTLTVVSGGDVAAKLEEIPPHIINRWSRVTVWAIDRFFAKPGVREDYEKWLAKYKQKKNAECEIRNAELDVDCVDDKERTM